MSESVEFSVDSAVSPVRVFSRQPDDEGSDVGVDGWPSSRFVRRLCPVFAESLFVPPEHGVWFDDQKRFVSMCPTHDSPENPKDRPVGVGEVWAVDLTLQDQDLVAECEDLGVAGVACGEYPSESVENKLNQSRKQGHERRRVTALSGPCCGRWLR
jgi:hypothetical protein